MTVYRCDVCRDEHTDRSRLTTIEARVNLYQISALEGANHVLIHLDLCEKKACRTTGLKQIVEAVGLKALDAAGLAGTTAPLAQLVQGK